MFSPQLEQNMTTLPSLALTAQHEPIPVTEDKHNDFDGPLIVHFSGDGAHLPFVASTWGKTHNQRLGTLI
jgi:hypothetical protein